MAKRLQQYDRYTLKELETYTRVEGSCVIKVNQQLHLCMGAYALANFTDTLRAHITRLKVGYYDAELDGIVLDVKNIKVQSPLGAIRADDPSVHFNVNADWYVFRPVPDAVLSGIVKYVGHQHLGVVIYRVFSVNIRLKVKLNKDDINVEDSVMFRISNCNLQNVMPYIEGELMMQPPDSSMVKPKRKMKKASKELSESAGDSGIEEKDGSHELDALVSLIKQEAVSDASETSEAKKRKRKRKSGEITDSPKKIKVKSESKSHDHQEVDEGNIDAASPKKKAAKRKKKISDGMETSEEIEVKVEPKSPKKRKSKTNSHSEESIESGILS